MPMSRNTTERIKEFVEIARSIATTFAMIAVPIVIALIGGEYNKSVKESENRVRYVELAIAQLRTPPAPETAALRDWAVDLLDNQAPIKLSPTAKGQLKANALKVIPLSGAASGAVLAGTATIIAGKATGE